MKISLGIKKPDVFVCMINHVHIRIITPYWQVYFMLPLAISENFQEMWHILPECKGSNSVANLQKTKIYSTNIDLVNDNVFTKFGLISSIRFQDIEQKPNSDINQGP